MNHYLFNNWKNMLKELKYQYLERTAPDFFAMSGGRTMKVKPYTDKTANGLQNAICDYIKFKGGDAQRINTMGTMRKIKGVMRYTRAGTRKGSADLHCIINGRHVSIEVKLGRDKMSHDQHKERDRIEAAGGIYFVATGFEMFLNWYQETFEKQSSYQC